MGGSAVKPLKDKYHNELTQDTFEGTVKERKCRDVLFLMIFIAFLGGMGYIAFLAFEHRPLDCSKFGTINLCKSCPLDICIPKDFNISSYLQKLRIDDEKIINDFQRNWKEILYMTVLSIGVVFLLCILLRYFAGFITWGIVTIMPFAVIGACTYAWFNYNYYQKHPPDPESNPGTFQKSKTWMMIGITLSVILVIFLLIILILRKRISLAIQLFKEAGKSLESMPLLLLQPVWTFILAIGCLGGLLYIYITMEVAVNLKLLDEKTESLLQYLRWYFIFGSIWIIYFIISCQEFVIASSVCMWYFCREKNKLSLPILKSIFRLIRYHIGSLALGSFLIALLTMIRIILEMVERKLKNSTGSPASFIFKCCQCCLWCFDKLLKFLNRNAYIEIAIYGYGFCKAARLAFMVVVGNALRVTAINSVGNFILFIAKIGIMSIAGGVGYKIIKENRMVNYLWILITCICLISYLISSLFFSVYEMVIDTLFICFCEDCNQNDGVNKPYFMSKDLMKFVENSQSALKKANHVQNL